MLMSMTAATYLFCAMVLWLGGWLNNERKYHSTKLQKFLSAVDLLSGIIIMLFVLVDGIQGASHYWYTLLNWASYFPYAMLFPASILLCQQRPGWKIWAHIFVPLTICLAVLLVWGHTFPIVTTLTHGILLLWLWLLYGYSLYKLRRWDRQMREEFSDISHKQTLWFRHLTLPFMLLPLAWIPLYFYPEQELIPIAFYLTSASLAIAMSSHALAHEEFDFDASALLRTGDADVFNTNVATVADGDFSAAQTATFEIPIWLAKLDKAMLEQHLYRQPDLTLSQLSKEIGVNRTYLSQYFGQSESGSFYNYIASKRIEEAKTLLKGTDKTLNEIAALCGFASQASLSRIFKSNVGCTPTEYRKNRS